MISFLFCYCKAFSSTVKHFGIFQFFFCYWLLIYFYYMREYAFGSSYIYVELCQGTFCLAKGAVCSWKNMYFAIYFRSFRFIVLFKCTMLLVFCQLVLLVIYKKTLKSVWLMVKLTISAFSSNTFYFEYFETLCEAE